MKKILKKSTKIGKILLAFLLVSISVIGIYNIIIPDSVSCMSGETLPSFAGAFADGDTSISCVNDSESPTVYTAEYKLLGFVPIKKVTVNVYERTYLYVGGMPFGVQFSTQGVMVIGYGNDKEKIANPGYMAGIRPSDIITKVNGTAINDINALTRSVEGSNGKSLSFTCVRSGKEFTTSLTPYYSPSENRYKTGLLVRDSGAGIGTVTYIVPESNLFGGLGHGICDGETGSLIPLKRGTVSDVTISGAIKGVCGTPGELRGSFKGNKTGSVVSNTSCGIFGIFSDLPQQHGELLPIALRNEIKARKAYIYCTLDPSGPQKYEIEISQIDVSASGNKCFTVKVTDPRLIEKTGGIVQGMSGSPIIQNGKLVGAVTHVLINDPTTGYGIFIENMLTQMGDMIR